MRRTICGRFMTTVMLTVVTFALILIPAFEAGLPWPNINYPRMELNDTSDDFIIERIYHRHENSNDMRSSLFLTHHGYLLSKIANLEVEYHGGKYTINNICFKPHSAIFHEFQGRIPSHFQRLLLEIHRLSPCLIVTPLNCFSDIYRIHAQMSRWNSSTDFLNRRLRNSFIATRSDNENAPYVKSSYGPELIEKWANHMFDLPSKDSSSFQKQELLKKVKQWLTSIQPRQEECADPNSSCNEIIDAETYFNICTEIQQTVDQDVKRNKFKFEKGDFEYMAQLDCVDDQQSFIEWMQEKELRKIMETFPSEHGVADREDIMNQRCDGIYRDVNSSGIEFFDGSRSFLSESAQFDTLKAEIVLMTPDMIVKSLRRSDYVNGFESIWTEEKAKDLLETFRMALKNEVDAFNDIRPSKRINVNTQIVVETPSVDVYRSFFIWEAAFLFSSHLVLALLFAFLVWPGRCFRPVFMFFIRDVITVLLFAITLIYKSRGATIGIDSTLALHAAVLTVINLFLTTRAAFYRHRLERCIQRAKNFVLRSNFSSIGSVSVDSVKERGDIKYIQYILAKYTKYQAAQDAYSDESFEKRSRGWNTLLVLFVPIVWSYFCFADSDVLLILATIAPSLLMTSIEEYWVKNRLLYERKRKQEFQKKHMNEMGQWLSGGEVGKLFAGNEVTTSEKKEIEESHSLSNSDLARPEPKQKLFGMSKSTCDLSLMKSTNQFIRDFRFRAIGAYFFVIRVRKMSFLIWVNALLFIFISCSLLFVPIQRETIQKDVRQDDLFISFSVKKSNWEHLHMDLKNFSADIDSITNLHTILNWHDAFERFDQEEDHSDVRLYSKWIEEEPITWAVTYPEMRSTNKFPVPSPFQFQFRYSFKNADDTISTRETVQKIDILLSKYSEKLSPKAFGVLYEHYHPIAVVWNSFAINELIASSILLAFFSLFVLIFSVCRAISSTFLFSFFVVGTRLEIAAIISLFSLEYHQHYANLALLIGFIAAWTPFCELARFRRRILYRLETRTTPEVASKRRIRVPFIAAVDIIHFFGILLTGSLLFAVVALVSPHLNEFFLPIVIFIVIQLCALVNSISILLSTKQMFEQEITNYIQRDLRGCKTTAQVCDMTGKLLSPVDSVSIQMDQVPIQPIDQFKFYAPPKKDVTRNSSESDDADEEHANAHDSRPADIVDRFVQEQGNSEKAQKFRNNFYPANAQCDGVFINPVQLLMSGMPLDSGYRIPPNQPINIERSEEQYEEERGDTYSDDEEEEDELMDSDVTVQGNEAPRNMENPNGPGPSNPVTGQDIPPIIQRTRPRDPLSEPPILEELIQQNDIPGLPPHPRANQYPPGLSRSFIAYCEDPYWTNRRTVDLPPGLRIPPRPFDYVEEERNDSPPPADPNWVPPPGTPPIAAVIDALAFRARRQQEEADGNPDAGR